MPITALQRLCPLLLPAGAARLPALVARRRACQEVQPRHVPAQHALQAVLDQRIEDAAVSNLDVELRVVAAGLGVSVTPRHVALRSEKLRDLCVIPVTDAGAKRRFAICFRDPETLSPAALRMVEVLASRAGSERGAIAARHGTRRPTKGMRIDASRT